MCPEESRAALRLDVIQVQHQDMHASPTPQVIAIINQIIAPTASVARWDAYHLWGERCGHYWNGTNLHSRYVAVHCRNREFELLSCSLR